MSGGVFFAFFGHCVCVCVLFAVFLWVAFVVFALLQDHLSLVQATKKNIISLYSFSALNMNMVKYK